MESEQIPRTEESNSLSPLDQLAGRRAFLRWTGGAGIAAAATLAGCDFTRIDDIFHKGGDGSEEDDEGPITGGAEEVTLDFSNDFGVLNYAYALEQLEAAFYILAVDRFYGTNHAKASPDERDVLNDLRKHEIVHRNFYNEALGSEAIPRLAFDFSSINFNSRAQVLRQAQAFEDIGVTAYNGAAKLLESTDFLVIAGKIVSVEARHASVIRTLLRPNGRSFAPRAFDGARMPGEVLQLASPFIRTKINVVNLPPA